MDNGSGGKFMARRNQPDEDDNGASQPSAIDPGATSKLELASGSADENFAPSGKRRQAEVCRPRACDFRLFGDVDDDSFQSIASEDSSTRPGATRINFLQAGDDDGTTISVTSQALESTNIISSPLLLEAELALDVDELVAQAFKNHLDTVAAQALQSQTATLPQQDARQEVENGGNGNGPIAIADAVIVEQPKLCGVVPRRYAVFGFLLILMLATAVTLGVVLSDNKKPSNAKATDPLGTSTGLTISPATPDPVTVNTPAPVSVNAPAPVVSTPPVEAPVSPTPAPTPAPVRSLTSAPAPAPTPAPVRTYYALRTELDSSLCLDVPLSSTENFTPLQLFPCNGTPAQMFLLLTDGKMYSALGDGNSCVEGDIDPGAIFSGFSDTVFLYSPCLDSWTAFSDGTFKNEELCLAFSGSAVSVEQCDGGNNQKWSFDQFDS
jgi:hypothetical protein